MMIDRRLVGEVPDSRKYIALNVLFQWISLLAGIPFTGTVAYVVYRVTEETVSTGVLVTAAAVACLSAAVRAGCAVAASSAGYRASDAVKKTLRKRIFNKLIETGGNYRKTVSTSEVVQVTSEGVEQLETYFGAYLPQLFYAIIAPLTLFAFMAPVSLTAAAVLIICIPLIPVSIAAVQTWAKKLLAGYWEQYTELGDSFLENLQGLTTLKIYRTDDIRNHAMNEEAEKFRKITMKVLSMQLNSITIMDLVAFGGAAAGVVIALIGYRSGEITIAGSIFIMLLSADFFIPMRRLGSFFHVAMNGMAASERIFRLLDMEKERGGEYEFPEKCTVSVSDLDFRYDEHRQILKNISMNMEKGQFTAIAGESGSGKSTVASLISGREKCSRGHIKIGGIDINDIKEDELMKNITYVGSGSYLFTGTVRDNIRAGNPEISEDAMWEVLDRVRLSGFLRNEHGLDTELKEAGANLSGGQRQRLAVARALLHNSRIYIFDEATSNIDAESENDIMEQIVALAEEKTVIVISHRLANIKKADNIYVLEDGRCVQRGTHAVLTAEEGRYRQMWTTQQALENYGKEMPEYENQK